jgi:hypothetical protein
MKKIPTSQNITNAIISGLRGPTLLTNWNKTVALLIPVVNESEARAIFQLIMEHGGGLGLSILQEYHEKPQDGEKGSKKC